MPGNAGQSKNYVTDQDIHIREDPWLITISTLSYSTGATLPMMTLRGGVTIGAGANAARRNVGDIQSRAYVELTATSPTLTPSQIDFTLEAAVFARAPVNQTIEFFDFAAGAFEEVDMRPANRFTDLTVVASVTGDLSRFVSPTGGEVIARARFNSSSARQRFAANIDQAIWTITP